MKLKVFSSCSLVILSLSLSSPLCQHGTKHSTLTEDHNNEGCSSSPPPPPAPAPAETGAEPGNTMLPMCRHGGSQLSPGNLSPLQALTDPLTHQDAKPTFSAGHDACITWRHGNQSILLQNVVVAHSECSPERVQFWSRYEGPGPGRFPPDVTVMFDC